MTSQQRNPLDDPAVGSAVFFSRPDLSFSPPAPSAVDTMVDVGGAHIRLRVHRGSLQAPLIVLFHGNGETARDYDEVSPLFLSLPATLAAAEYRGYGPSTGTPSVQTFLDDAHRTLDYVLRLAEDEARTGPLIVMGRSLGSAPAIELASCRPEVNGLIVESGFARFVPLLELLGVPARGLGLRESHGPSNLEKMTRVRKPTLILHARGDEIIPYNDATALHENCAAQWKRLVTIEAAGHNDIMSVAGQLYFDAISELFQEL